MKLLHLDSSALGANSISRVLSAAVVEQQRRLHPEVDVSYRDLDRDPIPHLTAQTLAQADPAEAAAAEAVMQQFLQADVIVIGAPMYNFAIPSTLKAWIDRIAVAGLLKRSEHVFDGRGSSRATAVPKCYMRTEHSPRARR